MADSFRLTIDLEKLAANLAAAAGRPVCIAEARAFLLAGYFVPTRDGAAWLAEEISLRLLDRSEYTLDPAGEQL